MGGIVINIHGKKVTLRALELEDMEALRSYHNDPVVASLVRGWSFPISSYQQKKWYESMIVDKTNHRFAVETEEEGFIGISTLTSIDIKNRSAQQGLIIGNPDVRGRGYGLDTIMATMRYAFEELQLNRLDGDIVETNLASLHLYLKKCGWVEEGRLRQYVYRNNQYYDGIMVGILKDEYLKLCKETNYWEK